MVWPDPLDAGAIRNRDNIAALIAWRPALAGDDRTSGLPALGEQHQTSVSQLGRELPWLLVIAVVIAFVVKTFGAQLFYIPSASMDPQLGVGDRVLVSKLAYDLHDVHRGDIVVFQAPVPQKPDRSNAVVKAIRGVLQAVGVAQPSTEDYIKRVIALPGETVETRNGEVWIDGEPLVEPYLSGAALQYPGPALPRLIRVPRGTLWVMGDNRGNSQDSRFFGPIKRSSVIGRAVLRLYPFGRISFL